MSTEDFKEMMSSQKLRLAPTMFTFNVLTAGSYSEGDSLPVVILVLPATDIQISSPLQGSKVDFVPRDQPYFSKDEEGSFLDISKNLSYPKDPELKNWLQALRIPYQEKGDSIIVPIFKGFALETEFYDSQRVQANAPLMWDADFSPDRILELKDGRTIRIVRKPVVDF